MQDKDVKGITQMILGPCGTNVTLTLSPPAPPPSREGAPPPRELNPAVILTISKFGVFDSDGDDRITRDEYLLGFDLLDKDKNDFVTREELVLSLSRPLTYLTTMGTTG